MKKLFTLLFVLMLFYLPEKTHSQTIALDSIQIERVAKTCQLWGHLKYFHPYLYNNDIDWESAFTQNIADVISAKDRNEFGEAVQKMLDKLNDPATQVIMEQANAIEDDGEKYPKIDFIQDSVLLISIKDYKDLDIDFKYAYEQFLTLKEKMPMSKGVIFDLRSTNYAGEYNGWLSYFFQIIESNLSIEELYIPGMKARFHEGFKSEAVYISILYSSGHYIKGERYIYPAPTAIDKPIVFVCNKHSYIPLFALALQQVGKANILSTDPFSDALLANTTQFDLENGVKVTIRLNELPSDIDLKADYLLPENVKEQEVLDIALSLVKGQGITKTQKQKSAPSQTRENSKKNLTKLSTSYPDLSHRLLAAAKIWTVIDYFFAYKDLMEDDWDEVLKEFIPRFVMASDSLEYHLAVAEMYTYIQDGHGVVRSKILSEYFGTVSPPVKIRFIEEQPVVTRISPDSVYAVKGIDVGDIIMEVDGENVSDRINRYAKYRASSNQSALFNYISRSLLKGKDSTFVELKIQKQDGKLATVALPRSSRFNDLFPYGIGSYGDTLTRLINEDIGYANLDRLTVDQVDKMFDDFKDTKAIIFDVRGYPQGTAWSIAPCLTDKKHVTAAKFRVYSPMTINMSSDEGRIENVKFFGQMLPPTKLPTYKGLTVMLMDERTQSHAEHSGLFLEAANGTKFIGSQTAGANGNVTSFQIPGNITLTFTGLDIRHADGRQLQKIGLVPDVEVKPTIKGIREGRDEVLEKAIEYIEGRIKK